MKRLALILINFLFFLPLSTLEQPNFLQTTPCIVDVCDTPEHVAEKSAAIFLEEVNKAKALQKRLIFILPSGRTATPFYNKLVEYWNEGQLDLSNVITFNSDEYVGLPIEDPNSYHYLMNHLFFDLVNAKLTLEKLHRFGLVKITKEDLNHSHLDGINPLDLNYALDLFKRDILETFNTNRQNTYASILETLKKIDSSLQRKNSSYKLVSNYLLTDRKFPSLTTLAANILHNFNLKEHAILEKNIHIPYVNTKKKDHLKKTIDAYIKAFETERRLPDTRIVTFCGIGEDPPHIAFNDFLSDPDFKEEGLTDNELTTKALYSKFRLVTISEEIRNAKASFFEYQLSSVPKYAVAMGFNELLESDRLILMAFGVNKAKSLYRCFSEATPTYKIPSSLIRYLKKAKPELIVDKKSFGISDLDKESLAQILHNTEEALLKTLFALKEEKNSILDLADVPTCKNPSCILNDKNAFTKNEINLVRLPVNKTILWVSKNHNKSSQLIRELSQNNRIEKHNYKNFQLLEEAFIQTKPDYLYLPECFKTKGNHKKLLSIIQKKDSSNKTIGIYHPENCMKMNFVLPLTKSTLERKIDTLNYYHCSQAKRACFNITVPSLANEYTIKINEKEYPSESFNVRKFTVNKNGGISLKNIENSLLIPSDFPITKLSKSIKKLRFSADDIFIIIAPHPDDAEISLGGLIHELGKQNVHTVILNITEGFRVSMCKNDLLNSPTLPHNLLEQIKTYPKEQIEDQNLKKEIRASESTLALEHLHQRCEVHFLHLPFYKNKGYEFGNKDKILTDKILEKILSQKDGNIYFFIPRKDDMHTAHKQTNRLFSERIKHFFREHPEKDIHLALYSTPWTGECNLYYYNESQGSEAAAVTGSERLLEKGKMGYLPKFLGGKFAEKFFIENFPKSKPVENQ